MRTYYCVWILSRWIHSPPSLLLGAADRSLIGPVLVTRCDGAVPVRIRIWQDVFRQWMERVEEYVARYKRWITDDDCGRHCRWMRNGPGEAIPFYGARMSYLDKPLAPMSVDRQLGSIADFLFRFIGHLSRECLQCLYGRVHNVCAF